jgi:ferritin-like metal-binding protein YciE
MGKVYLAGVNGQERTVVMKTNNLEKLFVAELKDLYSAEKQITQALPKLIDKADTPGLRKAFENHLHQTQGHVRRLENAFDSLDVSNRDKECKGMQCIIEEGNEMVKNSNDPTTRDAALISAAQHVEHYEMAGYGTAVSYAHQLELHDLADEFQRTLDEEKETDRLLTQIAENDVNYRAL